MSYGTTWAALTVAKPKPKEKTTPWLNRKPRAHSEAQLRAYYLKNPAALQKIAASDLGWNLKKLEWVRKGMEHEFYEGLVLKTQVMIPTTNAIDTAVAPVSTKG